MFYIISFSLFFFLSTIMYKLYSKLRFIYLCSSYLLFYIIVYRKYVRVPGSFLLGCTWFPGSSTWDGVRCKSLLIRYATRWYGPDPTGFPNEKNQTSTIDISLNIFLSAIYLKDKLFFSGCGKNINFISMVSVMFICDTKCIWAK